MLFVLQILFSHNDHIQLLFRWISDRKSHLQKLLRSLRNKQLNNIFIIEKKFQDKPFKEFQSKYSTCHPPLSILCEHSSRYFAHQTAWIFYPIWWETLQTKKKQLQVLEVMHLICMFHNACGLDFKMETHDNWSPRR